MLDEAVVRPAPRHQLVVTPFFDNARVLDHDDAIRVPHGREPMRDDDRRAALHQTRKRRLHLRLALGVEVESPRRGSARGFA
jgi:hypothetical protein